MKVLKNIWKNISTILISFLLAILVWVSAVVSEDPNKTELMEPIQVEIVGLAENKLLVDGNDEEVVVELDAPQSIWDQINSNGDLVLAKVDVSGLSAGEYFLPIELVINTKPVREISLNPSEIKVVIENLVSEEKAVSVITVGELATGFQSDELNYNDLWANISGPESLVNQVDQIVAVLDISGKRETLSQEVTLQILDSEGKDISGLVIVPELTIVTQTISPSGGYKNVAVLLESIGEPAAGYRFTNISVTPDFVTLYSSDPVIYASIPGFVMTESIDITGLTENWDGRVLLNLLDGVYFQSEEKTVLVQIEVSPIQSSDILKVSIQSTGLLSELEVVLPYETIELLLSGPMPILDSISEEDFLLLIDLTDLGIGTHLVLPTVESYPDGLNIDTIIPEIEIIIQETEIIEEI